MIINDIPWQKPSRDTPAVLQLQTMLQSLQKPTKGRMADSERTLEVEKLPNKEEGLFPMLQVLKRMDRESAEFKGEGLKKVIEYSVLLGHHLVSLGTAVRSHLLSGLSDVHLQGQFAILQSHSHVLLHRGDN